MSYRSKQQQPLVFPNLKVLVIMLIIIFAWLPHRLQAQRVFAPSEDGRMVELKEGTTNSWSIGWKKVTKFPRKMSTILPDPCKVYIQFDGDLSDEEVFVQQLAKNKTNTVFLPPVGLSKKKWLKAVKAKLTKISADIYELEMPNDCFMPVEEDKIDEAKVNANKFASVEEVVVGFRPTKANKKKGYEDMYFYAKLSQSDYDVDKVDDWTTEQAVESIYQIMEGKEPTQQLFASVAPVSVQAPLNGVQYVVVQNSQQVQPVSVATQPLNTEDPKEEKIESDVDINIPFRETGNSNMFALIIANEDYNKVAPVRFAKRDGQKVSEYINKSLGVDKGHIALLENATLNDMRYELNRLKKVSDAYDGECSFIIYYCGHGIPDEKNGNGYLLPVDGYGNDVSTAYSLAELYDFLGNLKSKRTLLFTDACFSGAGKEGDMLVAARGIAIKSAPNEASGNLIAFSACQGDETAYSYDEQGHGLMTYFFLKKIKDTKGNVSLSELSDYLIDNVSRTAVVVNGKPQTPNISVSPTLQEGWKDMILSE